MATNSCGVNAGFVTSVLDCLLSLAVVTLQECVCVCVCVCDTVAHSEVAKVFCVVA